MELFIPSVLILLLAAAVVFFLLPRFGAPVLALISVGLLAFGIYQHMNAFGTEYRLSTWQLSLTSYAPYVMIGGLLIVIAFYLLSISPLGKPNSTASNMNMPEFPSLNDMPSPNTATNAVTAGVNNALKGIGNAAAAIGIGNAAKNGKAEGAVEAANKMANQAVSQLNKVANQAKEGVANALSGITGGITKAANEVTGLVKTNNTAPKNNKSTGFSFGANRSKPANNKGNTGFGVPKGMALPELKVPLSQI